MQWARLGFWGLYVAVAVVLAGSLIGRLFRRINPYYAARQIEEALPDAKNSVVNWLDLREEKLPPAIKIALGLRAAHVLKDADPEQVTAGKHSWMLMIFTLLLVLGLGVLLVRSGPGKFVSLMERAFLPMHRLQVASPTEITLTQPARGDAVIAPRQSIVFRATISGVVPRVDTPEAPRLNYRYQDNDAWGHLPLAKDLDGTWAVTMPADLVQNGFFYKLSAAEAETPQFEVKVRSLPQAKKFDVTYHFQPYLRLPDISTVARSPRIKAHRGTEVTLVVHANHPLREGLIELHPDGEPALAIPGEINPDQPDAFRVKFMLDKSGSLRILFSSAAGEDNSDRSPYPVQVLPDLGPNVVLTRPGKDVSLPANGTLQVEGAANDDFGVKNLALRLKLVHGQENVDLAPRPYRSGASLQFADGSYPDYLDYKDFLVLDQLKSIRNELVPLAKGTVLAYWLEATDNSEFPSKAGNVGKSKVYHVTIADPQDEKKQQEQRRQAGQEQQRHEKDQDQDLKQQEQDRKDNRQRTPQERREERDFREKKERLQEEMKKQENGENVNRGSGQAAEKATQRDVDDWKQKLEQNGPDAGDAADKLEQAAEKASDPKVRKAAEKALKDNGLEPQPPARDLTPKDVDNLEAQMKQNNRKAEAAERKLSKASEQASDPRTREAAEKVLKDAVKNLSEKDVKNLEEKLKQKGLDADAAEKKLAKAAEQANDPKTREAAEKALKDAIKNLTERDVEKLKEKLNQHGNSAAAEKKLGQAAERADDPKAREAADKALKDAIKNLSEKDIKKLAEKLKQPGAEADAAEKKLGQAAEQADDPKARESADKALKDAIKNLSEKDIEKLNEKLKKKSSGADDAEKKLARAAEESNDPEAREAASKALKEAVKNLSEKDVKNLTDKLHKKGSEADAAQKKLAEAMKEANDPKAREAADKALKDSLGKLKEMLDKKGLQGELAEKALKQLAKDAKNPELKKEALDALKNAPPNNGERTRDDVEMLKELLEPKGPAADFARQELKKIAENGKDLDLKKLAKNALRDHPPEPPRNSHPDPSASQRAGSLQLEDLKVTPEILKKAGISEKEWEQMRKYEAARRAQQNAVGKDDPLTRKGEASQLPSTAPQLVNPSANPTLTPTQSGRGQPPPGFRELYQRWTTRQPPLPENK